MKFLKDPWQNKDIPLNGYVERHQFRPWFMVVVALAVGFITFQFVVAPIALVVILVNKGVALESMMTELLRVMNEDAEIMLTANTVGQFLGLALPILIIAKLSTSSSLRFLRVTMVSPVFLILSLVGLMALIPIVDLAATLTNALPWPQSIRDFEELLSEPLRKYLSEPANLIPGILMIAATPAICEELLFRGYVLRQAERSMGPAWAIVFTGLIFGAFHILPTQFLALSLLGGYMAYLTWRTGSILPAVLVHLANNTFAVVMNIFYDNGVDNTEELEKLGLPFYFVVGGAVVFACCIYLIESVSRSRLGQQQSTIEVDADLGVNYDD